MKGRKNKLKRFSEPQKQLPGKASPQSWHTKAVVWGVRVQGCSIPRWPHSLAVSSVGIGLQDMEDARWRRHGEQAEARYYVAGLGPFISRIWVGAVGAQNGEGPGFDLQNRHQENKGHPPSAGQITISFHPSESPEGLQ